MYNISAGGVQVCSGSVQIQRGRHPEDPGRRGDPPVPALLHQDHHRRQVERLPVYQLLPVYQILPVYQLLPVYCFLFINDFLFAASCVQAADQHSVQRHEPVPRPAAEEPEGSPSAASPGGAAGPGGPTGRVPDGELDGEPEGRQGAGCQRGRILSHGVLNFERLSGVIS